MEVVESVEALDLCGVGGVRSLVERVVLLIDIKDNIGDCGCHSIMVLDF